MCGINILLSKNPIKSDSAIKKMNDSIIHRGPDSSGFHITSNAHLAMRRLSVIDLYSGNQPVFNEQGDIAVVFNGEIYNYPELKRRLLKAGHHFSTSSDTEVIVHAYEEWGQTFPCELKGMFAFALWDGRKNFLYMARDRLGQKPLYYHTSSDVLHFSSELKSIMDVFDHPHELSMKGLNAFFSYTFIPSPLTIYEDIYKFPPACYAIISPHNLEMDIRQYWQPAPILNDSAKIADVDTAVTKTTQLVTAAVKRRMLSDVPLGAFLSGGVDSSIVVAILSDLSNTPVRTFSIANQVNEYDESHKAETISKLFNTQHTTWLFKEDDLLSILDQCLLNFDEPFADSSALPSFILSSLARKHVTVALSGDGGDEIFGGYSRYLINEAFRLYACVPSAIRKHVIAPFIHRIPDLPGIRLKLNQLRKLTREHATDAFSLYFNLQSLGFSTNEQKKLFPFTLNQSARDLSQNYYYAINGSQLRRSMYCDLRIGLDGDMLTKVDRTSMIHSLEVRNPFLDSDLVDFSLSLPDTFLIRNKRTKWILKKAFENRFPKNFLDKPKMGFGIPIGMFLKTSLKGQLTRQLSPDFWDNKPLFNLEFVKNMYRDHCRGIDRTFPLWTIFVFGKWFEHNRNRVSF